MTRTYILKLYSLRPIQIRNFEKDPPPIKIPYSLEFRSRKFIRSGHWNMDAFFEFPLNSFENFWQKRITREFMTFSIFKTWSIHKISMKIGRYVDYIRLKQLDFDCQMQIFLKTPLLSTFEASYLENDRDISRLPETFFWR